MSTLPAKPPCIVCKTPSVTRCSRCRVVHYCSETCQRKDWPSHKIACTPASKTSGSGGGNGSSNTTTASTSTMPSSLPNPDKVLHVQPLSTGTTSTTTTSTTTGDSKSSRYQKRAPQASCTKLKFEYQPSMDQVDENLVIFFHGLGDKIKPGFVKLAQSLQLPQSATCCVQAPTPVPYLEEEGWQWFPSFNVLTGELLGPDSPERMVQVEQLVRPELVKFIRHCVEYCHFDPQRIILFGFSQGGEIALDLAAFGGYNLNGVISVAGYLMEEARNKEAATKLTTRVLIMQGDKDDSQTIKEAQDRFKYVQRVFGKSLVEQKIVEGMGHGMPNSEAGWRPLMEFFAHQLHSRQTALEDMADVYEVKS
ncbi:hypothetical protein EDD11_000226 [Mortierella claussenii]|nr:hypothetical protein EDD11_000226 [Mortierella claussenii]